MSHAQKLVGLEILVPRLSTAVDYFTDVLGGELVFRGESAEPPGERAVIDAGTVTVTLFEPATTGDGVLPDRRPRVTQIIFGGSADTASSTAERSAEVGVPMRKLSDGRRYVAPEVVEGIVGFDLAMTFAVIDDLE